MTARARLAERVSVVRRRLAPRRGTEVLALDEAGLHLSVDGDDRVVDVLFDGRRIWSFWLVRDTVAEVDGTRRVAWPPPMRRFLDGHSVITVREHVAEVVHFEQERRFGTGAAPIAFRDNAGLEISLDKSGRFSPTFSVRSKEHLVPLLDAMEQVVVMLGELGITAFPAYGTLLGAIREGTFLGHDSDADLGYVSHHSSPVDAIRESFQLQRRVVERGFSTHRYSGGAFRIDVVEADGTARGLDLFGGFYDSGRLYLLGEVGTDFAEEWLRPYGTCVLAGREFPAPARPDLLLEAMYGTSWRVPDPAYKFETPRSTVERLNAWYRGTAVRRRLWARRLGAAGAKPPASVPSSLARRVADEIAVGTTVLDVGAGRGQDAVWLARQGFPAVAYDFVPRALRGARTVATRDGLDVEVRTLNLTEWRSTLVEGARVARLDGPRAMLARHVLDATDSAGREALARFASATLRGGGRLYAEVWTGGGQEEEGLHPVDLDRLVALVEAQGGRVVAREQDAATQERPREIGRLVVEWA